MKQGIPITGTPDHPGLPTRAVFCFCACWGGGHPITRLFAPLFFFVLVSASATLSQSPAIRVRLYSLHPEPHITVKAKTGDLRWRSCESCEARHASALAIE